MSKILSIKEKVPQFTMLPDGTYLGTWGGSIIVLTFNGKTYELETDEGVRGVGYKVVVTIKNSIATFVEIEN